MSDQFLAEIRIFPFNFPPTGWAFCNGQLMPISQNTALFALLGTTYGGDGKSTFALPDLQGNAPMQPGQGQGLSLRDLGEMSGVESITLLQSEIPVHTHAMMCNNGLSNSRTPDSTVAIARTVWGLLFDTAASHDGNADPVPGGRRAAAQQHAAVPHPQLLHRPAGDLPAAAVASGRTTWRGGAGDRPVRVCN
jgi:microcystin-dependent protein